MKRFFCQLGSQAWVECLHALFQRFFKVGGVLSVAVSVAWSQTGGGPGISQTGQSSLTLVNALPGPENLHVKFGQEDIWPAGFTPGQSTGAVLFPSGKKKVQLTCMGFAPTLEEISLPPGGNFAMVFFPGENVKEGSDVGKKKIGLFCPPPILADQIPKGKNWNILLVGPMERVKLNFNGQPMELRKGESTKWSGKEARMVVESGQKMLLASSAEEEGNYWIVIYGDRDENIQAVLLNHVSYKVQK